MTRPEEITRLEPRKSVACMLHQRYGCTESGCMVAVVGGGVDPVFDLLSNGRWWNFVNTLAVVGSFVHLEQVALLFPEPVRGHTTVGVKRWEKWERMLEQAAREYALQHLRVAK